MTIELTSDHVHGGIVALLLLLQLWHHHRLTGHIERTSQHINQMWGQIGILTTSVAAKIVELDKKIDGKVGKEDKTD
jgi:hypothetical protein